VIRIEVKGESFPSIKAAADHFGLPRKAFEKRWYVGDRDEWLIRPLEKRPRRIWQGQGMLLSVDQSARLAALDARSRDEALVKIAKKLRARG
jgi:hypothetical protein